MPDNETATEWSLRTWKERHENGYFPKSRQHADWRIFAEMPDWFHRLAAPTPDDLALEIGAGFGEWMIPLSRSVGFVHGVDIHPALVAKAREKFQEHGVTNAAFRCSDGLTLPYPAETFNLVYSISVFQHLPRAIVHDYLRESDRVMRPCGRAVHYFRNADNVGPYPPLAEDITANHTGDFSCGWTAQQVRDAGQAVGWSCQVEDIGLHLILVGRKE